MDGAAACVRCQRSDPEHDLERSGQADEVQVRIWKALGWPCPEFTLEAASIFARNQARTSGWARRPEPSPVLAPTASAPAHIASRGAAAARAALQHRYDEGGVA